MRWIMLLCAMACAGDAERTRGDTAAATAQASRPEPPGVPGSAIPPELVRVPWHPFERTAADTSDLGTGFVTLAIDSDSGRVFPSEDTLRFRAAPSEAAPVVAALIRGLPSPGGWSYEGLVPAGLRLNFVEYGYEESGVPTDSVDSSGRWVRAIVGFTPQRAALRGWASLDTKWVETVRWDDHLLEHAYEFIDDSAARLYPTLADAEAGRAARRVPTPPYVMEPLEHSGPWLRVRLRWPSDPCTDPLAQPTDSAVVWIRYLDARGRPLVWYPTRGC